MVAAMRAHGWHWLPAVLLLLVWLALSVPRSEAGRVPCDRVISKVNREVRIVRGESVDISHVAKQLGTSVAWVEHCMRMFGRRPKRPGHEAAGSLEAEIESFEEEEPEEAFAEDVEEPGARERIVHPPKARVFRSKPPPTPQEFEEWRRGFQD
jgi:hypothetical protein